jgi:hypothetical protein
MVYLKDAEIRKPPADIIKRRRERFDELNAFVTSGGGWLISTPGNRDVVVECLPESRLPNLLADRGYVLKPEQDGERIGRSVGEDDQERRWDARCPDRGQHAEGHDDLHRARHRQGAAVFVQHAVVGCAHTFRNSSRACLIKLAYYVFRSRLSALDAS